MNNTPPPSPLPPPPPPAAPDYEVEKRRLECVLLEHEIELNRRKWFMKLTVWGAIIPIVIAAVTLGSQLYTGYFTTQSRLAALEKKESASLKESAEETRKSVAAELAKVEQQRKEIGAKEAALKTEAAKLEKDQRDVAEIRRDYDSARQKLTEDQRALAVLREDVNRIQAALKAEEVVAEGKLAALRFRLPIETQLQNLIAGAKDASGMSPQHPASVRLIELVKALPQEQRPALLELFHAHQTDKLLYGNLLYVLYHGTEEAKWLTELFALAENFTDADRGRFWNIFGTAQWRGRDQMKVWEAMIRLMRAGKLDDHAQAAVFLDFRYPEIPVEDIKGAFSDPAYYRDAVSFARRLALRRNDLSFRGFMALVGIAPEVAVFTAAEILADSTTSSRLRREIEEDVELMAAGQRSGNSFSAAMTRLGFPVHDLTQVKAWLAKNQALIPKD